MRVAGVECCLSKDGDCQGANYLGKLQPEHATLWGEAQPDKLVATIGRVHGPAWPTQRGLYNHSRN